MLLTRLRRRIKFGEVSCTERTGQGNDFELIPTVKMETRHPVEGSFRDEFPWIYTVSPKNVPPLACYNFNTHEWILIFLAEMLPIK